MMSLQKGFYCLKKCSRNVIFGCTVNVFFNFGKFGRPETHFLLKYDLPHNFGMLPDSHLLKERFEEFMSTAEAGRKKWLETFLRKEVKFGGIEVNIMTKVDKNNADKNGLPLENGFDALQTLKDYAENDLENCIGLSN